MELKLRKMVWRSKKTKNNKRNKKTKKHKKQKQNKRPGDQTTMGDSPDQPTNEFVHEI